MCHGKSETYIQRQRYYINETIMIVQTLVFSIILHGAETEIYKYIYIYIYIYMYIV